MRLKSTLGTSVALAAFASFPVSADVIGVFHENQNNGPNTVFVFGEEGLTGTIVGGSLNDTFTIGAGGVLSIPFGNRGREMSSNGTVNTLSYRIRSDDPNKPVSALALNRANASTDMTTLLDTSGLGTDYLVLATPGVFGAGSQMSVTAVEDNTTVTITSPVALGGNAAGTAFNVTLNAGEAIFYESGSQTPDLSGTRVSADRNVAVFAGAECPQIPVGRTFCDHVISQQFKVEDFDTEYLIATSTVAKERPQFGDVTRVIASEDGTEVFLNGVSQGTINAGEVLQIVGVAEGKLTSTLPVMVGQFLAGHEGDIGDPAFAILPSVDQQLKGYAYATPIGGDAFGQNFLNIAIEDSIASSLMLNGLSVDTTGFNLIGDTLFGNVAVPVGFGVIEASDTFFATIAGYNPFDSYYSVIATSFSPGVSPPPTPPTPPTNTIPLPATAWMLISAIGLLFGRGFRRRTV